MGLRALAAMMTIFNVLLRIVPSATTGGHGNRNEEAGHDHTQQHGAQRFKASRLAGDGTDAEIHHQRRQHRQQGRDDHFLDRRLGQHIHRAAVIRLFGALHDARLFLELAPHFFHHAHCRATNRRHRHAAEQIRQQAAEQQANHNVWAGKREGQCANALEIRIERRVLNEVVQILRISGKQHQRTKTG